MAKIMFCFSGTGDTTDSHLNFLEKATYTTVVATNDEKNDATVQYESLSEDRFHDDVIRVYIRGCENTNVGGNSLFPDLDILTNKINSAFNKENKTFDIANLRAELGNALVDIKIPDKLSAEKNPVITNIALHGFSRGGVATFAVAKKLNYLDIPIDIIANQPVPG